MVSDEKSAVTLTEDPWAPRVLSLLLLPRLPLSVGFNSLIIMSPGVNLFDFTLLGCTDSHLSSNLGSFQPYFFRYSFCPTPLLFLGLPLCKYRYIKWYPTGLMGSAHFSSLVLFPLLRLGDFNSPVFKSAILPSACSDLLLNPLLHFSFQLLYSSAPEFLSVSFILFLSLWTFSIW